MILAIVWDFKFPLPLKREGLGVFTFFLFEALLEIDPNLKFEIWHYSANTGLIKDAYGFLEEKYPNRVFFYNENLIQTEDDNSSCEQEINWDNVTNNLEKSVAKFSKADAVYIPYVINKLGHCFECSKYVAIHDLFTVALSDIFGENINDIDDFNCRLLGKLNEYVKDCDFFICSTDYVAQNHICKYLNNVTQEQLLAISFPPMIKDFDNYDTLSEEAFRQKYNIKGAYFPYPTVNRPNKNIIVLLKALKVLNAKGIDLKFVMTGCINDVKSTFRFVEENDLKDSIVELGSIPIEDLSALYKYSSLVVIPTIMEGLGMSGQALEALKIGGIPVVHSKSLGIEDSLKSVGLSFESADLNWFDVDDFETLSKNIEAVLNNPQEHILKQKIVLDCYTKQTWADVAKKYIEVFKTSKNVKIME